MISERLLSRVVRSICNRHMRIEPCAESRIPGPTPGMPYMLYAHMPFCERLCPYCSFNRFPFSEKRAVPYFENLRREMMMLKELGYDFDSLYIGGGTPTILIDELCDFIDLAKREFSIRDVSCETNPNHLTAAYIDKLEGRVDRLSVGVQSFDDGLLKQMDRYDKYGDGQTILSAVQQASPHFKSLNVDMIFNFPAQTEEVLRRDLDMVIESGASQTTFYPLMASPSVEKSLARTVGEVDYAREAHFYEIVCEKLAGTDGPYEHGSAWTFNRKGAEGPAGGGRAGGDKIDIAAGCGTWVGTVKDAARVGEGAGAGAGAAAGADADAASRGGSLARGEGADDKQMIDEYIVDYEEYPAIGSGGMTYLGDTQYVNTFSVRDYNEAIESGRMSIMGKATFSKHNRMRYRFMMQLFGLRLDKAQWKRDFGCSVAGGLPVEYAYMKLVGAFDIDDDEQITLTPKGRYLMVAMMRQFFIGVNSLRDQARSALPPEERDLLFGAGCPIE